MKTPEPLPALEVYPLTPGRWSDLERLFGKHGASGGCWCMWWRLPRAQYRAQYPRGGQKNKEALKAIVDSGEPPGLLAYAEGEAIAWCSVGPRPVFGALERSRTLKRVDDAPVWSVVCFFVAKPYRGRGVMVPLLEAAVEYARSHGAKIVEGYPVEPAGRLSGDRGYTGIVSAFRKAGFVEVVRRGTRPIMRHYSQEDLGDSLEILRAKAEGEATRPLEEYLRERGARDPSSPDGSQSQGGAGGHRREAYRRE